MGNQLRCVNGSSNWTAEEAATMRGREHQHVAIMSRILPVYDIIMYIIAACGLMGNACCLCLLLRARSFRTAHFIFYKFLAGAELLYCCNFYLDKILIGSTVVTTQTFRSYFAAAWLANMSAFIYSSTGYLVMYMTILISIDRLVALWFPQTYYCSQSNHSHPRNCYIFCWVSLLLSSALHSWAAFAKSTIRPLESGVNGTTYYKIHSDRRFSEVLKIKDKITIVVRLSYPLVLLVLTIIIIIGFVNYRNKKGTIVSTTRPTSTRPGADSRRETSLFLLLIIVLVMALCQVLPTEFGRILSLIHPKSTMNRCMRLVERGVLNFDIALHWNDIYVASQSLVLLKNLGTLMERSFKFYFYLALNTQFRKEFKTLMSGRLFCQQKWHYLPTDQERLSNMSNLNTHNRQSKTSCDSHV